VLADEACVSGDTRIATPFGFVTIEQLAKEQNAGRTVSRIQLGF
jgi:hypothetical protein